MQGLISQKVLTQAGAAGARTPEVPPHLPRDKRHIHHVSASSTHREDGAQPVPEHTLPGPGSAPAWSPALPVQAAQSQLQLSVLGTWDFTGIQ